MAQRHTYNYRLVRLQCEELIQQCKRDDYEVWGAPDLKMSEYQAEESLQRATTHARNGLVVWGLVVRSPEDQNGSAFGSESDMDDANVVAGVTPIICHCESYQFTCLFRKLDGDVVTGSSYHVNAVFTLPAYRGRGLGKFFVREVGRQLSRQKDAVASVLYSDIGPKFYDCLGWKLHRSVSATIEVEVFRQQCNRSSIPTQPLYLDEALEGLLFQERVRLEAALRDDFVEDQEVFAVVSTRNCLEWQFCSGVYHAHLQRAPCLPRECGIKISDEAFVLWTHDFRSSTLLITYLSANSGGYIHDLVTHAVDEAYRMGLRQVQVWDPQAQFQSLIEAKLAGVSIEEREDSLSSLMVFKHVRDDPNRVDPPLWLHNERFAWV